MTTLTEPPVRTVTATARPPAWWRTAPNPPCSPWCERSHEEGEFAVGAGMSCARTISQTDLFYVEVTQYHGGEEGIPGQIYVNPVQVYIDAASLTDEFLDPDDAERLLGDLAAAVSTPVKEARA